MNVVNGIALVSNVLIGTVHEGHCQKSTGGVLPHGRGCGAGQGVAEVDAKGDRRRIGVDIKTVEYGWPIGMPICRPLGQGLWEVRTKLRDREVRVMFFFEGELMILTHGFVKKERQTAPRDMRLARDRKRQWEGISNVPQQ